MVGKSGAMSGAVALVVAAAVVVYAVTDDVIVSNVCYLGAPSAPGSEPSARRTGAGWSRA